VDCPAPSERQLVATARSPRTPSLDSNPLEARNAASLFSPRMSPIQHVDPITGQMVKDQPDRHPPATPTSAEEVERVLSMADGVFLLVDAAEGSDAADAVLCSKRPFQHGAAPDRGHQQDRSARSGARPVLNEVFDLFAELGGGTMRRSISPCFTPSGRAGNRPVGKRTCAARISCRSLKPSQAHPAPARPIRKHTPANGRFSTIQLQRVRRPHRRRANLQRPGSAPASRSSSPKRDRHARQEARSRNFRCSTALAQETPKRPSRGDIVAVIVL